MELDPLWVSALMTGMLVAINVYYAWLNRRLVNEMRRERVRPIAEFVEKNILTPFIQVLGGEINATHYDYRTSKEIFQPIEVSRRIAEWAYYEKFVFVNKLFNKNPKIRQLIREHNDLQRELKEKLEKLFNCLCSDEFKLKVQEIIDKYNSSAKQKIEASPELFAISLTNNCIETWGGREHYYEFYKKHELLFREFLIRQEVKEAVEERDRVYLELKKKASELKGKFENVRKKIVEEYLL